jgi:homoserine dehydrogenase
MRTVSLVVVGLGSLGRRFCELLSGKRRHVRERFALDLRLVGAADSRGAAYDPGQGLDPDTVARIKRQGGSVAEYPRVGRVGWEAADLIAHAHADALLEASPVNLWQGAEPGLTCIRTALERHMHVVTPNKGPLVVAFDELHARAARAGVQLRFDGSVAGGLPALYLGQRDLRGAIIRRLEAVPNLVTGLILDLLAEGVPWDQALASAWEEGVLEGDGRWDLDGWDAAAKLVILANAVLGWHARLEDVSITGVMGVGRDQLLDARARGCTVRLVAQATRLPDGAYRLSVQPRELPPDHPLGRLGHKAMGIVYETDIYGTITALIEEPDPLPSAATMLRDLLDIFV